jgi:hypothetical protein
MKETISRIPPMMDAPTKNKTDLKILGTSLSVSSCIKSNALFVPLKSTTREKETLSCEPVQAWLCGDSLQSLLQSSRQFL